MSFSIRTIGLIMALICMMIALFIDLYRFADSVNGWWLAVLITMLAFAMSLHADNRTESARRSIFDILLVAAAILILNWLFGDWT